LTISSTSAFGAVDVESHSLGVPYIGGCCVLNNEHRGYANFDVFQPTSYDNDASLPVILTIHNFGKTRDSMFAFNIELARRNFAVISYDVPGQSEPLDTLSSTDYLQMAWDSYDVLSYVRELYPDFDQNEYGVLADSNGGEIAIAMNNTPVPPFALLAVSYNGSLESLPITQTKSISVISGNQDEFSSSVVSESVDWLISSMHSTSLAEMLVDSQNHVYQLRDFTQTISILVIASTSVVFIVVFTRSRRT
jgi:hypothetical protein